MKDFEDEKTGRVRPFWGQVIKIINDKSGTL